MMNTTEKVLTQAELEEINAELGQEAPTGVSIGLSAGNKYQVKHGSQVIATFFTLRHTLKHLVDIGYIETETAGLLVMDYCNG